MLWGETRANIVYFTNSKHASAGHLFQHPFLKQCQLVPLALLLGTKVENSSSDDTACHLDTTLLKYMYFHTKITFKVSSGCEKSSSGRLVSAKVNCFFMLAPSYFLVLHTIYCF